MGHAFGFRLQPVVAGCALLLLGTAQLAQAQQANQAVTVTGIRRGIEAAISVKKNADGIAEAISAEDIGKLPNNSIAESIARLPGPSKNVSHLTVYCENCGFEARISQRKRSDYIGEIGNVNGARTLRYVVGESVVDAQLAYNFNEGSFKGLGVLLQVNNLTNEGYQTYAGTKDRPLEYIKWGKTVLLGANYKF